MSRNLLIVWLEILVLELVLVLVLDGLWDRSKLSRSVLRRLACDERIFEDEDEHEFEDETKSPPQVASCETISDTAAAAS